mgnify:FL=1
MPNPNTELIKKLLQQNEVLLDRINKLETLQLAMISKLDLLNKKMNKMEADAEISKKGWIF